MSSLMKNEIIKGRGEEIKFPFTLSLSPFVKNVLPAASAGEYFEHFPVLETDLPFTGMPNLKSTNITGNERCAPAPLHLSCISGCTSFTSKTCGSARSNPQPKLRRSRAAFSGTITKPLTILYSLAAIAHAAYVGVDL